MDNQTQSFLELSAKNDLVQLVADTRAAWLWSADGARILWANAAGASFFSAHSVSDLAGLTSLERSPARPHIARIAASGATDKFSIDRLRFYRGLRVMLLTCQCKKIELDDGQSAALIVCSDKGLALTKDPLQAFAHLAKTSNTTVFLMSGGTVEHKVGALDGTPEDLDLPDSQRALFGPLDLNGNFHEGVILQIPAGPKLIMLDDQALDDGALEEQPPENSSPADLDAGTNLAAAAVASLDAVSHFGDGDRPENLSDTDRDEPGEDAPTEEAYAETERAHSTDFEETPEVLIAVDEETSNDATAEEETAASPQGEVETLVEETGSAEAVSDLHSEDVSSEGLSASPQKTVSDTDQVSNSESGAAVEEDTQAATQTDDQDIQSESATSEPSEGQAEMASEETEQDAFVFQPRRRPVRFAWKMDVDRRFTFLSDEFSEVLGPDATNIVGLTWDEVSRIFDLDPRGSISRALDRRDTWSGKTINWPVSGAALRVPVDMAALPAFDRNRKFEGYRGFGVCRTAEAIQDPDNPIITLLSADDQDAAEDILDGNSGQPEHEYLHREDTSSGNEPEATEPVEPNDSGTTETKASGSLAQDAADEAPSAEAKTSASARLEDLKPAQPDSFSGKTFLGASAAALVGSLAKFTGKSAPRTPLQPQQSRETSGDANLTEDLKSAAAALDDGLEQREAEPARSDQPDLDAAEPDLVAETETDTREELADNDAGEDTSAPDTPVDDVASDEEDELEEPVAAAGGEETLEEPTGISGTAELKPAEIEDAVKSLQKAYNASAKLNSLDLFDGEEAETDEPDGELLPNEVPAGEVSSTGEDLTAESEDEALADTAAEVSKKASSDDEGTSGSSAEETSKADAEPSEEDFDVDERDFFEETAAFEREDQQAETSEDADDDPEPRKTGEVIPLATARPRVVPVDTSSLSRPERQAFRKIAEALGARLEGDLEDFDSPDPEEDAADLPPEVPEAGPIDPTLLDRLPIGIAIVHDREVLYANKALLRMLGYKSIAALSQAGGLEALFIDDTEELPDAVGMDDEVDETMKMRLADGGVLCVDAHMHSVPWNGSRGLMISITERPAKPASPTLLQPVALPASTDDSAELQVARNQIAEMDTILETATDGVLVLDQHGSIVKVNGSAEALFSASRTDMIGAPVTEFLAPESQRAAADYLDGLSRNGVASILNDGREVLGKVPTGGLIPLFMTMGRITNGKDDAKYCAVLRDITQWKTAEEELTQAKRQAENASSQKSDFLAKISHEIRTPLNAIIGFSEVMMEERFGPIGNDRYKDYLKDIRTSGSHIMSLINDLLDLSKIEAGKLDLNFSAVSTNDVINECVALMQPQANRERVIIRASLPESVPDVVADPRSLRQIVLNLLSNAIKYNKSGGQVILSTALESNGEVALRVRDTGTGMTAKQLAAALEPFRQLHTTSRGGGTGLGLPLTKALVEANRASFHIDSTPDQGTLVEIIFPTQRVLSE
ncbi:ATP-binding protein [Roseibium sp. SCPC15]|uniref:ATP-binding protein n=1 Tax=Roseibium sp. SCP15 TaxID=3141376 RepID=UPI0033396FD7